MRRGVGPSTLATVHRERGLVLIIAYKFVKGVLWLALATALALSTRLGLGAGLLVLAEQVRHSAHAWSLDSAKLLVRAATPRGTWTIVVALLADGSASLLEGWALVHGHWWGPWLVVVTTSALVPFEIAALFHHPRAIRFLILAVNLVIVFYLVREARREARREALREAGRAHGDLTAAKPER